MQKLKILKLSVFSLPHDKSNVSKKHGFTLIELLVVIAIIGILSSVVLASLSTARAKSRDARRISDIGQIKMALEMYYDSTSTASYPLAAFGSAAASLAVLSPTYLPKFPLDPTNTGNYTYEYAASTSAYILTADLERFDNVALVSDADNAAWTGINGTSVNCDATAAAAQPSTSAGERCYDITN